MEETPVCPICMEPVLDEGENGCAQDALFCEGKCQCWQHRQCASVTKEQYAILSDSPEPFLCPSCTIAGQQVAIASLQECLEALADEVRALKSSVAVLQQSAPVKAAGSKAYKQRAESQKEGSNGVSWTTVVKRGHCRGTQHQHRQQSLEERPNTGMNNSLPNHPSAPQEAATSKPNNGKSLYKKQRVPGARRLWGTLKTTTTNAVKSALSKLTSIGDKVTVKRKYKTHNQGRMHWWFVLKAEEEILAVLEKEWNRVALQLSWRLEPCFKPLNTDNPSDPPAQTSAVSNTENPTGSPVAVTDPSHAEPTGNDTITQTPMNNPSGSVIPDQD